MANLDALPTKTALGFRRSRFAKRQPLAKRIDINESDEEIRAALKRHPKLPAPYLFKFTDKKSYPRFQDRLTTLYNGTLDGVYYLDRPEAQFNNMNARYQPFVYSLPEEKGGGWFVHQLMGSCISASIELACREAGLTYFSRETILEIKNSKMVLPISLNGQESVVPDELSGIGYEDFETCVFPHEHDRATESIAGKSLDATYAGKKLLAYIQVMRKKIHKEVWGVNRIRLLFSTINEGRKESLRRLVYEEAPDLASSFLFKVFPEFGKHWKIPSIYKDILTWQRADGKPFDISRP